MNSIKFPEVNTVYNKNNEDGCEPLHAYKNDEIVLSKWKPTWKQRFQIFFCGACVWHHHLTFGRPPYPIAIETEDPFVK